MKRIEGESNLRVSFSKRRHGLFKKASELSVLCGCEIAVVIFTMLNRMFAFGSPSAEPMFNRFLEGLPDQEHLEELVEGECPEEIHEISLEIKQHDDLIKAAKEEVQGIAEILKNEDTEDHNKYWWLKEAGNLTLEEAQGVVAKLTDLEKKLAAEQD